MTSIRFACAVVTATALLFACDPYTPPEDFDGGVDAPDPDGPDGDGPDTPPGTAPLTVVRDGGATGTVSSNPGGIACGTTCSAVFDVGTVVTLTATPDATAEFIGWTGGGCSGTDPCTVTVAEATTVTATFDVPSFPVTVTLGGNGTGTVTATDLACPGMCTTNLPLGAMLTLTATPSVGAVFTGWSGACSGTALCTITVAGATDVTANFALNQTLIVAKSGNGTGTVTSAPTGITCGADCDQTYPPATMVTLTAAADADSIFTGWSGGSCSGTGTCVVTVSGSVQVTATFVLRQFTLTVNRAGAGAGTVRSTPAGIDCGADCSEPYDVGTIVTLTAAPSVGALFQGWSGGGCIGTGTCVVTMAAATTVSASFAPIVHTLTVVRAGTGSGTVGSVPAGIACGADCNEDFAQGTMVTLTATPNAGSSFTGWTGGGCTGTGPCVVTMAAATTATATFIPVQYTLTVTPAGAGTGTVTSSPMGISCGADCAEAYNAGTGVTLTAVPAAGSTFTGWSGAGCAGTGTCVVAVNAAATVTATFALAPFTLTVVRSGTGTGTISSTPAGIDCGADCAQPYDFGTSVILTAAPATGSTFAGWSGGGCSGTGTCTISIAAATTVTAAFTANQYLLTAAKTGAGTGTVTSSPTGITCGADCSELYDHGSVITLTATPSAGSTFGGWTGGGCSGTGTCVVTLTAATSVSAAFTLDPSSLTVTRAGTGTGTITSSPAGIDCGADCTEAYASGTSVTLTAAPSTGSMFTGWSGGGCTGTGTCVVTISAALTVTATFALDTYPLMAAKAGTGAGTITSSPAGIDCGADCSEVLGHGTSITLTATPAAGSSFTGWSGGGCSGTGTCIVNLTAATTVTATFTLNPYTLTAAKAGTGAGTVTSSPAGISCGADCSEVYNFNQSVTLTAAASTGSTFSGWSGGGCTGTGTCIVTMTAATTVTATFAINPYTLTAAKSGTGTGTVTSSPAGINCGADCSEPYDYNTPVTLTATPSTGSSFTGWSGGGCTGTGTCVVAVTAATTVTATFTTITYPLNVDVTGSGSVGSNPSGISCGTDCSQNYAYGTMVTLTATPVTGNFFDGWTGGGCSGTGTCTVTMDQARSVIADFDPITTTLTVTPPTNGSVGSSPSGITCGTDCTQSYTINTSVLLTATPAAGYQVTSWGGACSGTGNTCTLTMSVNRTASVTFGPTPKLLTVSAPSFDGVGTGSVSSSPIGITCGTDCTQSYTHGTVVTLTATPGTGSYVTWSGACTGTGNSCMVTMDQARTATATFAISYHTLTVSRSGTGSGSVAGSNLTLCSTCTSTSVNYQFGSSVSLTPTPAAGFVFANWGGACTGSGACTVSMTQARSVTATFAPAATLTVQPWGTGVGNVTAGTVINCGVGGGGGSDCTETYAVNTSVTLSVSVAAGSVFTGWSNGCTGTMTTCTTTMSASKTVRATIEAVRTLNVSVAGSGSITSDIGGINCPGSCSGAYAHGSVVTLSIPASSGIFVGWGGACSGSANTCTVTMDAAKNVTANFWYVITLFTGGPGYVEVNYFPGACAANSTCQWPWPAGQFVTYTPRPDPGHVFVGWGGGGTCGSFSNVCSFTVGPSTTAAAANFQ